ncbi:DUF1836 domain-containing protein [Limosilactobacillus caccae]|jgi:hypothetical protein|uniref:DUF1836 domain-containing protein n=1 Tax=Limosilactobacillus caccae TaxID=1926284 RepID=UPI00097091E5|nr:DUF1836 domain-containing protein [Limosilactobacillus caccae]
MNELKEYQRWQDNLSRVRFPRWKELPTLGLYVDQVVAIVNEQLSHLGIEPLTKSMVNNYVKKKVIQAPIKKKYAVNQLVDLLLIGLLKANFSLDDIRAGIAQVTINSYPQAAYDRFVVILNSLLAGDKIPEDKSFNPQSERLITLALQSVLASMQAAQLLAVMKKIEQPAQPAKANFKD